METKKRLIYVEDILLGVEAFKKCYRENASLYPIVEASLGALTLVTEFVNRTPTVDAVEVVRCKDCKHYRCGTSCVCELHSEEPDQYGNGFDVQMLPFGYCSHGERRTDG